MSKTRVMNIKNGKKELMLSESGKIRDAFFEVPRGSIMIEIKRSPLRITNKGSHPVEPVVEAKAKTCVIL